MPSAFFASSLEQTIRHYGENAKALTHAARHHFSRPGKRTRAKLFFAASPFTQNTQALIHVAAAVELIHEASIVHDDIQDRTEYRRGIKTVWHKFGANAALLLGDHLVACAFRALADAPQVDSVRGPLISILSTSVSRAASGQHLQLTNHASDDCWSFYRDVAIDKTGALIALPLQFATLLEQGQCSKVAAALGCGEQLGLAYQIINDLTPFAAPSDLAGHEDFVNRTITAPIAACNALFPGADPFQILIRRPEKRQQAVQLCQRWLNEALLQARHNAALLPEHSKIVVETFIQQQLLPTAAAEPPARTFTPWPQSQTSRIEAV